MPEQYTINGTITAADGAERAGVRVQAFDRDLPSLERRSRSAPLMLGEAVADAEGTFKIAYTLEQFQDGEGPSQFRRSSGLSADVSFRVFDRAGRELTIKSIDALNSGFAANEIIFNAPADLDVSILLEPLGQVGDSEFEQLVAVLAPVIGDVSLTELMDDDVAFLTNELGLEQQRDVQQRIEWLRRSALLARVTLQPIEAFYGWGRKGLLAPFAQLAALPVKDLPTILEKLAGSSADELGKALEAAIAEKIIPLGLRGRVGEIVRLLKRRNEVLHEVVAQLQDEETEAPLVGHSVTTFDKDDRGENLGLDITDHRGRFSFSFYLPRGLPRNAPARQFVFRVITPHGESLPEGAPTAVDPNSLANEVVSVKVKVPKPQLPALEEQLQDVKFQAPPAILKWLSANKIATFADIRRVGGLSQVTGVPVVDPALIHTLDALADLDRISISIQMSKVLLDKGYDSVLAIAEAPYSEFSALVREKTTLTQEEVARLHVMATVQTDLLNNILMGMAADNANGMEHPVQTEKPGGNHS